MTNQQVSENRTQLLQIFSAALQAVEGRACVRHYLQVSSLPTDQLHVVALGKAAASMMQGALDVLGSRIDVGLVITKYHHGVVFPASIKSLEAAHPVSDANSLLAGQALLSFVQDCPVDKTLLILLSGGASALVEVLPPGITIEQLAALNTWLLSRSFTIHQINTVRKAVSLIKGGKLARQIRSPHCYQLILSDVPGNDLSVIGSGLFVEEQINTEFDFSLPDWIASMLRAQDNVVAEPRPIKHVILADNQTFRHAVTAAARQLQLTVFDQGTMSGDAESFIRQAVQQIMQGENGLHVWGGETFLTLPPNPGRGGRCQHMALAAALPLAGNHNIVLLAGATDGTDGPGDVAGAIVDGNTISRGQLAGLEPVQCLARADAGHFLEASGDLLDTGPTGTNVNDVVIALKWSA